MKRRLSIMGVLGVLTLPAPATAQAIGVAAKAGLLGAGAEVALGLGENAAIRAGGIFVAVDSDFTFSDIDFSVESPKWYTLGIDLYPGGGSFRLSGGLFIWNPDDIVIEASCPEGCQVGATVYSSSDIGTLIGGVEGNSSRPFVTIGLGKHTASGFGLFVDAGVAFTGDLDLSLGVTDNTLPASAQAQLEADLNDEANSVEDDLPGVYPILQLGVRIGLGG